MRSYLQLRVNQGHTGNGSGQYMVNARSKVRQGVNLADAHKLHNITSLYRRGDILMTSMGSKLHTAVESN